MSHSFHDALAGYHPDQILVDECPECERRAMQDSHGLAYLDPESFVRALNRARQWQTVGLPTISDAERPLLYTLWCVWVQLERAGIPNDLSGALRHLEAVAAAQAADFREGD